MTHPALQFGAWLELALCWLLWFGASARKHTTGVISASAPAGILGLLVNIAGLACLAIYWRPAGYHSPVTTILPAMLVAPLCVVLAWRAHRHLGQYWHAGAVLREDHKLIKTGPYARMRHPIYASLLGMAISTAFAYSWWPFGILGVILTLLGIQLRIKAEEHIMERFFQDEFIEYEARSRAFFPY